MNQDGIERTIGTLGYGDHLLELWTIIGLS
jgi:hypothetical protein